MIGGWEIMNEYEKLMAIASQNVQYILYCIKRI